MQLVLTNAPQLLNLVDVLTSLNKGKIQGRVWASNTVQDKEFLPQATRRRQQTTRQHVLWTMQ
jgi:hypothetical protein